MRCSAHSFHSMMLDSSISIKHRKGRGGLLGLDFTLEMSTTLHSFVLVGPCSGSCSLFAGTKIDTQGLSLIPPYQSHPQLSSQEHILYLDLHLHVKMSKLCSCLCSIRVCCIVSTDNIVVVLEFGFVQRLFHTKHQYWN